MTGRLTRHLFKRLAHLVTSRTTAMADSQAMTTTTPIVTPSVPPPTKRIKLGDNESADNKTSGDGSDGSDHSVADNTWRSKLDRNFDERDVGISEFIGDYKPFEAVLKNRYEDFLVHEIAKNGQILRLIDNRMPEEEVIPVLDIYEVFDDNTIDKIRQLVDKTSSDSTGDVSSDKVVDECVVNTNADQTDETIDAQTVATTTVTTGAVDDRKDADNKDTKNGDKNCVKIPVNGLSKHERTRIHKAIKDNYEDLETSTVDDTDGHKYIVVKRVDKGSAPARNRHQWPKHKGEYIHFVMYKENRETQQALNELALKMRISAKNFAIAGTKDKRAITTQAVSAWKVPPQRIWYAARGCRDIEVGHFQFAARELRLGELCGNRFDIVLRDVKCSDRSDAERSLQSVATIGAINYYGMQRFGFQYDKPYSVGVLILRQQWEAVVESLLSPRPTDMRPVHNRPGVLSFNECLDLWRRTRDAAQAYDKCPYKWTPEASLLRGLSRVGPKDFAGALCTGLPRSQRLLYLHCYQSYVWNKSASYRVRTYGHRVVAGDLLLIRKDDNCLDIDGSEEDDRPTNAKMAEAIVVADEHNMSGATIYDIVLPVIGNDNRFPENSVADYIRQVLAEEQVTIDQYRDLPKNWCVYGTYRPLFVKPQDFQYEWREYEDPNQPLVDSDLVAIRQKVCDERDKSVTKSADTVADSSSDGADCVHSEKKLALKLSMSLPRSTYATMICRQICRTETTVLEYKLWYKSKYNV